MARVLYRRRKAARWLAGKPVELMRGGRIDEKAMAALARIEALLASRQGIS